MRQLDRAPQLGESIDAALTMLSCDRERVHMLCRRALAGNTSRLTCEHAELNFSPVLGMQGGTAMAAIVVRELPSQLEQARRALNDHMQAKHQAEAVLAETTSEFQATFDLAAVGIAYVAPDGAWLRVNQVLCDMLGYTQAELRPLTFQDLTHPDDLDADLSLVQQVLRGEITSYTMEKRYLHRSGRPVWGHLTVSLVRDSEGAPKYFISVVKNIDMRKRTSVELERSRARLEAILDSLSEGVFVFNQAGDILEANPAALDMFGYASMEETSGRLHDLAKTFEVHTLDGKLLPVGAWPIVRVFDGQTVCHVELQVRRRDSERTWIASFNGSRVEDHAGTLDLGVLAVRDITERKRAETALRASEERFRMAFDSIPDIVVIYDAALHVQ
ncbi:MAG: PAS domain S-box protein, partial [Noviherbaspirillum sp.]